MPTRPKLRLWEGLNNNLKFSARLDLKLPTASDRHGLGTGDPDLGLVGIATYKLGKTSFDSNVGYYAIDIYSARDRVGRLSDRTRHHGCVLIRLRNLWI